MRRPALLLGFLGTFVAPVSAQQLAFSSPTSLGTTGDLIAPFAVDLGGDGTDELVAVDEFANELHVYRSFGGEFIRTAVLPTQQRPSDVAAGDLNGDCLPDLVVTNRASGSLSVYLQQPDGRLTAVPATTGIQNATRIELGHMNQDEHLDAVVMRPHFVEVWIGDGAGGFTLQDSEQWTHMTDITLGDVDNDGNLDVMGTRDIQGSGAGFKHFGSAQGNLVSTSQYYLDHPPAVLVDDFDNNGLDDFAFIDEPGSVWGCHFTAAWEFTLPMGNYTLAQADFNNDGKLDLVVDGGAVFMNKLVPQLQSPGHPGRRGGHPRHRGLQR